jgi:hypothetical protein
MTVGLRRRWEARCETARAATSHAPPERQAKACEQQRPLYANLGRQMAMVNDRAFQAILDTVQAGGTLGASEG